jgi:hypothetical protein
VRLSSNPDSRMGDRRCPGTRSGSPRGAGSPSYFDGGPRNGFRPARIDAVLPSSLCPHRVRRGLPQADYRPRLTWIQPSCSPIDSDLTPSLPSDPSQPGGRSCCSSRSLQSKWPQTRRLLARAWVSQPGESQKGKCAEPQSPQAGAAICGSEVAQPVCA